MARGRPRTPTKVLELRGTYRPDRHAGADVQGEPLAKLPSAPKHLSDEARKVWKLVGRELVVVGVLTTRDLGVLADYCSVRATILDCEAVLSRDGRTILGAQGLKRHPELVTLEHARAELRSLGALLGLSPSDRARLKLPSAQPKPADDPWDEVANG